MDKNTSHPHVGHRQRVKDRYVRDGLDGFEDHQLLELLLFYCMPQGDTNALAHQLIAHFGGLDRVLSADVHQLMQVKGIGEHSAILLSMYPGIHKRINSLKFRTKPYLQDPTSIKEFCASLTHGEIYEQIYVISLDTHMRLIRYEMVGSGTIDEAPVYPRLIVESVLKNRASNVILTHNHPSGHLIPSIDDVEMTTNVADMLAQLNVAVIDHIITSGEGGTYSMREQGVFAAHAYIQQNAAEKGM